MLALSFDQTAHRDAVQLVQALLPFYVRQKCPMHYVALLSAIRQVAGITAIPGMLLTLQCVLMLV